MKLDHPVINKLGGLLGSAATRAWMATLDYKGLFYDRACDVAYHGCRGQKIYIFWHEYLLFPIYLRGHCNLAMLLSRHRDAKMLSHAAYHLGFDFVRGSTNRGGVGALRALLRKSRNMHLTITPDGPRGPRRHLAPGSIYLASRLGMPLILLGLGYDRPWRVPSWDRFAVPRPGSLARSVVSPEIFVPPDLDRAGLEHFRVRVERLLNRLCDEAEAWAESGRYRAGQFVVGRRRAEPLSHTEYSPAALPQPDWLRHATLPFEAVGPWQNEDSQAPKARARRSAG